MDVQTHRMSSSMSPVLSWTACEVEITRCSSSENLLFSLTFRLFPLLIRHCCEQLSNWILLALGSSVTRFCLSHPLNDVLWDPLEYEYLRGDMAFAFASRASSIIVSLKCFTLNRGLLLLHFSNVMGRFSTSGEFATTEDSPSASGAFLSLQNTN